MQSEHVRAPTVKTMLYCYRVALTGVHLLRTGEVEANLTATAPRYGFDDVLELVERKRAGAEKAALPADLDQRFRDGWVRLAAELHQAHDDSTLPPEPTNHTACSEWLVCRRIAEL